MAWRCDGILSLKAGIRCCQGTIVSLRLNSFFTYRNLKTVGVSPKAITLVLNDRYQLLQEDLKEDDVQIGGVDPDGNPIVVEIDKSKFGKRKGSRVYRVSSLHSGPLIHQTVNHSIHFVAEDGAHTNTIELNCMTRPRNKKMMPWVLVEFMWRRKHYDDLWDGLMKALKNDAYFTNFQSSIE
ncbi:hypothetical protein BCV72DRAFT_324617 [Rhizopus microsporus var. microsporus]|uniref:ISXO2-like transposase domain-containing protein n=1 Tax=Rhizopus microsporus var. microsporus TaxID=86635 RepID=A0A1X0R867_RHIZD|nr:hypothetical protein BCV72DRAFT_324617 [Rhizopus microsporus var. microsporus]